MEEILKRIDDFTSIDFEDFGELIVTEAEAIDNSYRDIGRHLVFLIQRNKDKPEILKAINDTVTCITGWCIETLLDKMDEG